ncbi:MAG: glycosyltransferase [Myxococcales bacterium]|nr:glycosyltransferase [Myxococcales bacterium]
MKVLIFGVDTLDCAAANCGIALRRMGHQVHYFDPAAYPAVAAPFRSSWRGRFVTQQLLSLIPGGSSLFERSLVRVVEELDPDLVLVISITSVSSAAIEAIKARSRAKVAGWFQDHVVNFGRHEFMLAPYDGLFFKDPYIVERLHDFAGMENVFFLPEGCEPSVHRPVPLTAAERERFSCELMTYGNFYPYRAKVLEHLDGFDLRLYGGRPARWIRHPLTNHWQGRDIYREEKAKAVAGAKIVLSTSHFGEIRSANARVFEVAGIGGFQVADAPGVGDYFEPGREIVTFKGPDELRKVISHYLPREDERREIAERGRARAHREHTYEARLTELFQTVGLASTVSSSGSSVSAGGGVGA